MALQHNTITGIAKYTIEEMVEALDSSRSLNEAASKMGVGHGGRYFRHWVGASHEVASAVTRLNLRKLIEKHGADRVEAALAAIVEGGE